MQNPYKILIFTESYKLEKEQCTYKDVDFIFIKTSSIEEAVTLLGQHSFDMFVFEYSLLSRDKRCELLLNKFLDRILVILNKNTYTEDSLLNIGISNVIFGPPVESGVLLENCFSFISKKYRIKPINKQDGIKELHEKIHYIVNTAKSLAQNEENIDKKFISLEEELKKDFTERLDVNTKTILERIDFFKKEYTKRIENLENRLTLGGVASVFKDIASIITFIFIIGSIIFLIFGGNPDNIPKLTP